MSGQAQWICFQWVGRPRHDVGENTSKPNLLPAGDAKRRDSSVAVPPLLIREWLNKPWSMRRGEHDSPEASVAWFREVIRQYEPQLPENAQFFMTYDEQAERGLGNLRCGVDVIWYSWLTDGSTQLVLAILRASA